MKNLTSMLDKVAAELETRGLRKLATEVDTVSNTLERRAADTVLWPHGLPFDNAGIKKYLEIIKSKAGGATGKDLAHHVWESTPTALLSYALLEVLPGYDHSSVHSKSPWNPTFLQDYHTGERSVKLDRGSSFSPDRAEATISVNVLEGKGFDFSMRTFDKEGAPPVSLKDASMVEIAKHLNTPGPAGKRPNPGITRL